MYSFSISGTVPSVNNYLNHWRGRASVSESGRQFKEDLGWIFKSFYPEFELDAHNEFEFEIDIHLRKYNKKGDIHKVNHRRNIDNCLKVLLDAFEGIIYVDDLQVTKITVEKFLGDADEIAIRFKERI